MCLCARVCVCVCVWLWGEEADVRSLRVESLGQKGSLPEPSPGDKAGQETLVPKACCSWKIQERVEC